MKWCLPQPDGPCWRKDHGFFPSGRGLHPSEMRPTALPRAPSHPQPGCSLSMRSAQGLPRMEKDPCPGLPLSFSSLATALCPWDSERWHPGGPALPPQFCPPPQLSGNLGQHSWAGRLQPDLSLQPGLGPCSGTGSASQPSLENTQVTMCQIPAVILLLCLLSPFPVPSLFGLAHPLAHLCLTRGAHCTPSPPDSPLEPQLSGEKHQGPQVQINPCH